MCTDIHEHKTKLHDEAERCRRIVESSNEGIWKVSPDGVTVLVNPRMAEMLGCGVDELHEKTLFDFVFEEDLPAAHDHLRRCQAGEWTSLEWRLRRADGTEMWTLATCNPTFDPAGRLQGTVGHFTDLTSRKTAERKALDANERLAIDAAEVGLYVIAIPEPER
ncbi:MAG: PAS domain S-box protein [Pirellulaceae bacterium]